MEVRCQEGHWANRMTGFRTDEFDSVSRKRREDGIDYDALAKGASGHNHNSKHNNHDSVHTYGKDGNVFHYKPRWFYCNNNSWITHSKHLEKLDFAFSVKTHAVCEHAHKPPKFNDRCNVEHFDFGAGKYICKIPHDKPEEKQCRVSCAWPAIPRRLLKNGQADLITCNTKNGHWDKHPWGCDEPLGRGHQCVPPHKHEELHGHWDCTGPQAKHTFNGKIKDHEHRRRRRDDGEYRGAPIGSFFHGAEDEVDEKHSPKDKPHNNKKNKHNVAEPHTHDGKGTHYHSNGYYSQLHGRNVCRLRCDEGYESNTCEYNYICDPQVFPSWSPHQDPPYCVPVEMNKCSGVIHDEHLNVQKPDDGQDHSHASHELHQHDDKKGKKHKKANKKAKKSGKKSKKADKQNKKKNKKDRKAKKRGLFESI